MNQPALSPLHWALLLLWAAVSFGAMWFARDLSSVTWWGWPLHYWVAAQGAVVMFLGIVLVDIWTSRQSQPQDAEPDTEGLDAQGNRVALVAPTAGTPR